MNSKLDKITGTIKESTGKIIGSNQLELEGKLQKKRGEITESISEFGENLIEKVSEKVNDLIDKFDNEEE